MSPAATAGTRDGGFETTVLSRAGRPPIGPADARRLLSLLARRLGVRGESVAVVFGDDAMLAGLNLRYRGKDQATDVLSFPSRDGTEDPIRSGHLGDIAISVDAVRRQARLAGHRASREASILMIHGFLHLMGYDHEVDDGQMEELERTMRWEMLGGGARGR